MVPNNWRELRAAELARLDETLGELRFEADLVTKVLNRDVATLAAAFEGSPEYLARVFVVAGADRAAGAGYLAGEPLQRVVAHGDEPAEAAPASSVSVLSYMALMRCLGRKVPDQAAAVESRWLAIIAERPDLLNESDLRTAALAAVAASQADLVPQFVGGGALVPRNISRDVAGPNLPGFARHLAEVIKGGGGRDAVEEPWRTFLQAFPLTLASDGCRWVDLVWAATAIMVHFEQRPASDVGTWLPQLVQDLD